MKPSSLPGMILTRATDVFRLPVPQNCSNAIYIPLLYTFRPYKDAQTGSLCYKNQRCTNWKFMLQESKMHKLDYRSIDFKFTKQRYTNWKFMLQELKMHKLEVYATSQHLCLLEC